MAHPSGTVMSYPYLWEADATRGSTDAKDRTTCVAMKRDVEVKGEVISHLVLLGITDQI